MPRFNRFQYCIYNEPYEVKRESLDASILFYIREGQLNFNYRDENFIAGQDQIVILSGKHANHYYATGKVYFDWFHFSGSSTENYIEYLYNMRGPMFSSETSKSAKPYIRDIIDTIRKGKDNDHWIAYSIQGIFSYLSNDQIRSQINSVIHDACNYIDHHYKEQIQVDELSTLYNFSRFHFSRLFKKDTGTTPHQYLLHVRLL